MYEENLYLPENQFQYQYLHWNFLSVRCLCVEKTIFFPLNWFLFMTDKTDLSGGKIVLLQFHNGAAYAVLTCCHVQLLATPQTVAFQAPLAMVILQARILEWVAPSPGDLPNPGIEPGSRALRVDSLLAELNNTIL